MRNMFLPPESMGGVGGEDAPGLEAPSEEAAAERHPVPGPGVSSAHGTSGRVLTDAVLQTQRDTITAIHTVSEELKQIRMVLGDISESLKQLVKKQTFAFVCILTNAASHPLISSLPSGRLPVGEGAVVQGHHLVGGD